jgi:hypothetical protein
LAASSLPTPVSAPFVVADVCWNVDADVPMLNSVVQPKVDVRWCEFHSSVPNADRCVPPPPPYTLWHGDE